MTTTKLKPHDHEITMSWECFNACSSAFPTAEVTYFGYPDNFVMVKPHGCIEGILIDTVAFEADRDLTEVKAEVKRMTSIDPQLELPV